MTPPSLGRLALSLEWLQARGQEEPPLQRLLSVPCTPSQGGSQELLTPGLALSEARIDVTMATSPSSLRATAPPFTIE